MSFTTLNPILYDRLKKKKYAPSKMYTHTSIQLSVFIYIGNPSEETKKIIILL